jgi:hypothetical protein
MTLDEIKAAHPSDFSTNTWLREVCIQLALLNERQAKAIKPAPQR